MTLLMGAAFVGVVFFTSMLSGVFGMAGGLVLLWFLLVVFPASTAMAVHGVIQLTANASRAWLSRRFIVWRNCGTHGAGRAQRGRASAAV